MDEIYRAEIRDSSKIQRQPHMATAKDIWHDVITLYVGSEMLYIYGYLACKLLWTPIS